MGKVFAEIDDRLRGWIEARELFFVGTAPLSADGHVNVSPKGPIGTLAVLGAHEVAYLDFFGSGTETIGHLRENGRIVVMFCAFQGPPRIVRLHGRGEAILATDPRFAALEERCGFADDATAPAQARRAIVLVSVERISDSCGYGVPLMAYEGERPHYELSVQKHIRTLGAEEYVRVRRKRAARTLDGLPAHD